MNPNLRAWLDSTIPIEDPFGMKKQVRRIERIAELIAVNDGSPLVHGWGCIAYGSADAYGRTGLEQGEALELISIHGFLEAVGVMDVESSQAIVNEVAEIWAARVAALPKREQL